MAESENIGGNAGDHFFEGVEKLLEIWFKPNPKNKNADLRKIPRLVLMTAVAAATTTATTFVAFAFFVRFYCLRTIPSYCCNVVRAKKKLFYNIS